MSKFLTIGYGDKAGYARTDSSVLDAAHANDAQLVANGALIGIAGQAVQVRNNQATRIETREGAFMSAPLPIAGFAIIDADSIDEAIRLVAASPCAVADGVIEIWPIEHAS